MTAKKNLAVFCSGGGSNFKALRERILEKNLPCQIVMCLSNNSQCGAMRYARENGIDAVHLSSKVVPNESELTRRMLDELEKRKVDLILLAGYMKRVPKEVVQKYPKRILNIHPALLPKFGGEGMYGLNVHRAVLEAKEKESGATVHFVTENYDEGEIIVQEKVPVLPSDTPETLAARVLEVEHRIYADALEKTLARLG
ncbi:MAG: phosphoribosylglycinamide formyltransferase [Chloroherpetonaceae bacterium]|nr:phosphoribosylglycinamide formyltransferase [Chloroherpetonaceae bacterium]MDW8437151.1 phosphoribosylglycinamide formyltransferase [Chloroherpetonaceae bacterium]